MAPVRRLVVSALEIDEATAHSLPARWIRREATSHSCGVRRLICCAAAADWWLDGRRGSHSDPTTKTVAMATTRRRRRGSGCDQRAAACEGEDRRDATRGSAAIERGRCKREGRWPRPRSGTMENDWIDGCSDLSSASACSPRLNDEHAIAHQGPRLRDRDSDQVSSLSHSTHSAENRICKLG